MAELDEFLKPRIVMDIAGDPPETVWKIPFTQFLLPNGCQRPMDHTTPYKDVGEKAQKILDAGFHFTCEILTTGDVAFYITGKVQDAEDEEPEEGDAAIALAFNGPQVPEKVAAMIREFNIPEDGIHRRWK